MSSNSQENSIYVTLFSNDSINIYKNTPNTFTNLLQQSLNLNDQWVVGLSDVSFTLLDKQDKSKQNIINKRIKRNLQNNVSVDNKPNIKNLNYNYGDVKKKFRKLMDSSLAEESKSINSTSLDNTNLVLNKDKAKQTISSLDNQDHEKNTNRKSVEHTISTVRENETEEPILSLSNNFLENTLNKLVDDISNYFNKIVSPQVNDIIFIYTDIIKPRYVGNKKAKCLKIFSISSLKNYINFNRVEYFPVETFNINDISIMIRNDEGQELNLIHSIPVYCTLHFKKI